MKIGILLAVLLALSGCGDEDSAKTASNTRCPALLNSIETAINQKVTGFSKACTVDSDCQVVPKTINCLNTCDQLSFNATGADSYAGFRNNELESSADCTNYKNECLSGAARVSCAGMQAKCDSGVCQVK